jgi:hypothetical protein
MASKSAKPGFINSTLKTDGLAAGSIDGRVYGLHAYFRTSGGTAGYNKDKSSTKGRPITGMFTRIHTSRSMNKVDASVATCRIVDATSQIGCLVQADECSIGFAGKAAESTQPDNGAYARTASTLLLMGRAPTETNILDGFKYPLSRKLYVNSAIGFGAVWGYEAAMLPNEVAEIPNDGFIAIPAPFLEEYNEQALCGTTNSPAGGCANFPASVFGTNAPVVTMCGNGTKEDFEDCDNGTGVNTNTCPSAPVGSPATTVCNLACRTQLCFH